MNVAEISQSPMAATARPRRLPLLGGLLVKDRLINEAQLERVLALQEQAEPRPLLGQLLIDQKLLTPHELNVALAKYRREHLLGDILVETNIVTAAQLDTALASQRRTGAALGSVLVELGYITERQLKHALGIQLRIPFVDLDRRAIDPALAGLVSERYARRHRVLPIARTDDRVVVAMDDPTDGVVLSELRACTGLPVEPVIATSDALTRALARLYEHAAAVPRPVDAPAPAGPMPSVTVTPAPGAPDRTAVAGAPSAPDDRAPGRAADAGAPPATAGDPLRERAERWQRGMDTVDALLHEREERRREVGRLVAELRESHAALARARRELEMKASALARIEEAHDDLLRRHLALERSVAHMEERQATLLRDRQLLLDRVESVLRWLKP
jgi:hypothetical protein